MFVFMLMLMLISVGSNQMCEYKMTISTPLVCTKHLESASVQRLDELGVFGFSKTGTNANGGSTAGSKNSASERAANKNSGKQQRRRPAN